MKLLHIQVLRFLACAAVVLFHSLGTAKRYVGPDDQTWMNVFTHGYFGVDLFFVISGFIIYSSAARFEGHPLVFLRRRLERIVPIYWLLTVALVGAGALLPNLFKNNGVFDPVAVLASLSYTSFLWGQWPVLYVGWSLEYELVFYLSVFALLCRGRTTSWNALVYGFCALIWVGFLAGAPTGDGAFDFATNPYMLEFALGILVARRMIDRDRATGPWLAVWVTIGALAVSHPQVAAFGLVSAVLVALAARAGRSADKPHALVAGLAWLGDASYSVYLVQVLTISAACKALMTAMPNSPLWVLVLGASAISLGAGSAVFVVIERPLLRLVREIPWARPRMEIAPIPRSPGAE
jgi:exopolysaccharide production protein ExoZ